MTQSTTPENTAGAFVREKRAAAGLTQKQLADRAGVTATYVSHIENGREVPSKPETIEALAAAIGIDPYTLFHQFQRIPPQIAAWLLEDEGHLRDAVKLIDHKSR